MAPETDVLLAPWNAVYVEIPKVACTSLKAAFAGLLGMDLAAVDGDPHRAAFPSPGPRRSGSATPHPGRFTFAFVRNPWDRLLSCYRDKIGGEVDGYTRFTRRPGVADCLAPFEAFEAGMSFEAFALAVASIPDDRADAHFRSQHTFVAVGGALAVDFLGRYERLAEDFETVRRRIGLPDLELPRLQAAREPVDYAERYTPSARRAVEARFARDIELFGYAFGAR